MRQNDHMQHTDTVCMRIMSGLKQSLDMVSFAIRQSAADGYGLKMSALLLLLNRLEPSPQDVAANSLVAMYANVAIIAASAPLFAIGPESSRHFVAQNNVELTDAQKQSARERITCITTAATLYGVFASLFVALTHVFSSFVMQEIFRQDQAKADHAQEFLRLFSIAAPGTILGLAAQQVAFSAKKMMIIIPGLISLAACAVFSMGFGFGWGAMPKWGKNAVIAGYVGDAVLSSAMFVAFLTCSEKLRPYTFFSRGAVSITNLLSFLKVGAWPAMTVFCELMFGFALTAMAKSFGNNEQAAIGLSYNALWLNTFMAIKLALAAMVRLGRSYGRFQGRLTTPEERCDARTTLRRTAVNGVITTSTICAVLPVFFAARPDLVLSAFGHVERSILEPVGKVAPWFAAGFFCDAVSFASLFQARALQDNVISGLLRSLSFLIGAGLSAGLAFGADAGIKGLAMGYFGGMIFSLIAVNTRLYQGLSHVFPDPRDDEQQELQTTFVPIGTGGEDQEPSTAQAAYQAPVLQVIEPDGATIRHVMGTGNHLSATTLSHPVRNLVRTFQMPATTDLPVTGSDERRILEML